MSHYDSEYYFICYQSAENRPILAADAATADLAYSSQALPASALPLQFINGAQTESNKGIFSDSPPEILFHGSDIAVKHAIYQRLAAMELPGLVPQAASYCDHKGQRHDDYYFLTFTRSLDCWDRSLSYYAPEPLSGFADLRYEVVSYQLCAQTLASIPLSQRRLFKMGATTEGWLLAHESIADILDRPGVTLVPVQDFGTVFFP
ncbi:MULTISPECIES: hypothetical protein [unclassified Chromobacterium]|uniref:hypothetical protein n=1 Tax=unclassified Chromobacterium TaxID=2641838 RepID=UPI000652DD7F|nr:hypothetical protein [Chromobacterium sp. LK1]KMN37571.1 hypothetical protein VI26_02785 [Chromobacterium sp. LK1]